ncbi:cysteine--tRNA ligase [bacterium]|nr:cysteine--tRNA ligase [bacterium]
MALVFFNTLTRRKEEFVPLVEGQVRIYTCGPTVYDYAHIGNYRAYLFEDLLRRHLKYKGFQVTQVMNLTDVDDKSIAGVRQTGLSLEEYTARYKKAFFEDLDTLRIQRAEHYPEATKHIEEMVVLIQRLQERGFVYEADGSLYYRISSFPEYGKLSHMRLDRLKCGLRIRADEYEKEQASDFALWKAWEESDGEVFWETPLGKGRPGWHIECSAMSMKYLGEIFDIHTGGVDNIFPHHENEIAQSEGATGKPFVRYWMHNEHLIIEGKKMSKSLGNYYTLRDLLEKGHDPVAIRYLLMSTHYRQQLNFTFNGLEGAGNALRRIQEFLNNVGLSKAEKDNPELDSILEDARREFESHMDDDLNISGALGSLFTMIGRLNKLMTGQGVSQSDAGKVKKLMARFDEVLGVMEPAAKKNESKLAEIEKLVRQRQRARAENNWSEADRCRDELSREYGVILEDRAGSTVVLDRESGTMLIDVASRSSG